MSPRTICAPPTDAKMWKRALARCHPDMGGDETLFIWINNVRQWVCDDRVEELPREARREPSGASGSATERIPFDSEAVATFEDLTLQALHLADRVGEPYAGVLGLLTDCEEAPPFETVLFRQQGVESSYRQLARIAHESGMSYSQRVGWYRLAEAIPLSMRHAAHILSRL